MASSAQLSAIAAALSGSPMGHLVALHQLNEILVATDGARVGGILPYVLAALGQAAEEGDFGGDSEVAVLCVRAIVNIVDMDPGACRYLARPSALATLQARLAAGRPESEVNEAVCKLLALTAVQFSQSVLRSGALAVALGVRSGAPASRLSVLQALLHACEKASGREEAALLLDVLPAVLEMLDAWVGAASAGRLGSTEWPLLEAAATAVARLLTTQARLAYACLQLQRVASERRQMRAAPSGTPRERPALPASGGGGGGSFRFGRPLLPGAASSPGPGSALVTWPAQALAHACRIGAPQALARVLALHCAAAAQLRAATSPAFAALLLLAPPVPLATASAAAAGAAAPQAPASSAAPRGLPLGHASLRAVVQALARVIALQPRLAPALSASHGLMHSARLLLAMAAQDAGVDTPCPSPAAAALLRSGPDAGGFAAELETDAGASSGAPELWGAAGSHVAALGRLDDAVALVSALLPQRPPGPQPLPQLPQGQD